MSNDQDRAREAYDQWYRNQQQAQQLAAHEAIRLAQEAAARRNEFIQQNLPVYGTATEQALQRLRAQGFPGMIAVGSMPVTRKRKILGIIDVSDPNEFAPILGWPLHAFMSGPWTGLHGVQLSLVVDGSFYGYRQGSMTFDSVYPEGGASFRLSAEGLVAQLYDLGATGPEESRKILERINALGMPPAASQPQDTSADQ